MNAWRWRESCTCGAVKKADELYRAIDREKSMLVWKKSAREISNDIKALEKEIDELKHSEACDEDFS